MRDAAQRLAERFDRSFERDDDITTVELADHTIVSVCRDDENALYFTLRLDCEADASLPIIARALYNRLLQLAFLMQEAARPRQRRRPH